MKIDLIIEHPIQRRVFERLVYSPWLHFSELRERRVESNLLTYHLTKMVKTGLLKKDPAKGYSLSIKGRALADRVSLKTMQFRLQPKISTMIAVKCSSSGRWLMYRRSHQPFIELIGFPSGKVHFGETISKSVTRELYEKTGLRIPLSHNGDAYFTLYKDGEILTHFLGHIFYGEVKDELAVNGLEGGQGDVFWGDPSRYADTQFIPGYKDVISLIEKSEGHFFTELSYLV